MTLPFVLGLAGHVDHGKTSLIRALTGVNTDRLAEEQRRGMTIDLGFAPLTLSGGETVSVIDVPGHERFLKNMLAGIGGIDAALLVVAADDGVMPQTREHLAILSILGIHSGIVALTKVDLVDPELVELASLDIQEALSGAKVPAWPVIPLSSQIGVGLDALRLALETLVAGRVQRTSTGRLRLPVDRVFSKQGFGTVLTGTLAGGELVEGDNLILMPTGAPVRVRGIQVHGTKCGRAVAGMRVAVNVVGIEHSAAGRGDWLVAADSFQASHRVDVKLSVLPEAAPVAHRTRVRVYHGSGEYIGRLRLLDTDEVAPGGEAFAQIVLETPVVATYADRFVLRRYSPPDMMGGGLVLHPAPQRARRHHAPTLNILAHLASGDPMAAMIETLREAGDRPQFEQNLLAILPPEQRAAGRSWLHAEAFPAGAQLYMHAEGASEVSDSISEALRAFHHALPWRRGLLVEELAKRTRRPLTQVSRMVQVLLSQDKLAATGRLIHVVGHHPRLPGYLETCKRQVMEIFQQQPLADTADFESLGSLPELPALLEDMVECGELLRVGSQIFTTPAALAGIHSRVRQAFATEAQLTASQLREAIATSRKYAIPFLEYLDVSGFTRRSGDIRTLLARDP